MKLTDARVNGSHCHRPIADPRASKEGGAAPEHFVDEDEGAAEHGLKQAEVSLYIRGSSPAQSTTSEV
jgi:hypothetical protein